MFLYRNSVNIQLICWAKYKGFFVLEIARNKFSWNKMSWHPPSPFLLPVNTVHCTFLLFHSPLRSPGLGSWGMVDRLLFFPSKL